MTGQENPWRAYEEEIRDPNLLIIAGGLVALLVSIPLVLITWNHLTYPLRDRTFPPGTHRDAIHSVVDPARYRRFVGPDAQATRQQLEAFAEGFDWIDSWRYPESFAVVEVYAEPIRTGHLAAAYYDGNAVLVAWQEYQR